MTTGEVVQKLAGWARGSIAPFHRIDAEGNMVVDLSTAEAQANLHLIKKLDVTETREELRDNDGELILVDGQVQHVVTSQRVKIELYDAKDAADKVARVLGMLKEHKIHTGVDGGPIKYQKMDDEELMRRAMGGRIEALLGAANGPSPNGEET